MPEESDAPAPPIQQQPIPTVVPGLAYETGYYVDPHLSLQGALEAEDRRTFRRAVPAYDDIEALRHFCNQPADSMPHKRHYDGAEISDDPGWSGLRVEVIAFPLTPGESRFPVGHPWVYHEFPGFDGPCIIARWLHRYRERPGVLEVGWDGQRFFATQVRRSLHFIGPGAAEDAAQLLALWTTGAEGQPQRPHPRPRRSREYDLNQAVRIARALLNGTPPQHPTTWRIAEEIAKEEDSNLTESGLTSRWQRHKWRGADSITLGEVLSLAMRT